MSPPRIFATPGCMPSMASNTTRKDFTERVQMKPLDAIKSPQRYAGEPEPTDEQVNRTATIIDRFGFTRPIVVMPEGRGSEIERGEHRTVKGELQRLAAVHLDLETVPVIVVDVEASESTELGV